MKWVSIEFDKNQTKMKIKILPRIIEVPKIICNELLGKYKSDNLKYIILIEIDIRFYWLLSMPVDSKLDKKSLMNLKYFLMGS